MSDRCPGILRLHEAADGQLARVRVPGGRIDARGLRAVAAAARTGNGIVELTSRASLQIRGLTSSPESLLRDGGLLPSLTHERVRNIIASPLASRETLAIVAALDQAICAEPRMTEVSARWLFAVDDGSGLHGRAADVTVTAADQIPAALAATLCDLTVPGVVPVDLPRVGTSDRFVTALAPLGRLTPEQLEALAGFGEIRIGVGRTVTVPGTDAEALRAIGLIDDPDSGWVGLTACAGLGACNRALRDVRADAAARAELRTAADGLEHHAACPRCCGAPADDHRAFTATVSAQ